MKKRKGLIIGIVVAIVVLAGASAAYIFAGDIIANKFALLTKSGVEYFQWVSDRQVKQTAAKMRMAGKAKEMADRLSKMYGVGEPEDILTNSVKPDKQVTSRVMLEMSDELSDMLGLVAFKRDEVCTTVTTHDGTVSVELVPKYNSKELLKVRVLANPADGILYGQIPTYKEDLIEMSSLYEMPLLNGVNISDALAAAENKVNEIKDQSAPDMSAVDTPEEMADAYTRYLTYLSRSFEDATVEKKCEVNKVGGEKETYTKITVKITIAQFDAQVKGLVDMLEQDGLVKDTKVFTDAWKKLVELAGSDAKGECDLFVDNKGNICGGELRGTVKATKVAITYFPSEKGLDALVSVNSINALTVNFEGKRDDGKTSVLLRLKPEAFVKTLMGDAGKLHFEIGTELSEKDFAFNVTAYDGEKTAGQACIEYAVGEYKGDVLKTEGLKAYAMDTLFESKYFDATALAKMVLDKLDEVDEGFVNDYINSKMGSLLGDIADLDTLRMLVDTGLLDMFSGTGPAIGEEPEPEPEPTIPGLSCVSPDEFVPRTWEYPAADAVFTYSHTDLAGYANIGKYKGIVYAVPVSDDITQEQIDERKQKFLAKYAGLFYEDDRTIAVQDGDEIYFDIIPLLGGFPITAYAYYDCYELMGLDQYGEGLDAKLLGMRVGETRDIEATLGDQFEEFAGYTGIFRVTLKKIDREVKPAWTDSFVCGRLQYDSLAACEQMLLDQLISEADVSEDAVKSVLVNMAWESTSINPLSEELMNGLRQKIYDGLYEQSIKEGMSPIQQYIASGKTVDDLVADMDASITPNLPEYCFYGTIARAENVTVRGSELVPAIDACMADYNCSTFDELMKHITVDEIADREIMKRIDQLIYNTAVVSYK